jgi:hypothetical protein
VTAAFRQLSQRMHHFPRHAQGDGLVPMPISFRRAAQAAIALPPRSSGPRCRQKRSPPHPRDAAGRLNYPVRTGEDPLLLSALQATQIETKLSHLESTSRQATKEGPAAGGKERRRPRTQGSDGIPKCGRCVNGAKEKGRLRVGGIRNRPDRPHQRADRKIDSLGQCEQPATGQQGRAFASFPPRS